MHHEFSWILTAPNVIILFVDVPSQKKMSFVTEYFFFVLEKSILYPNTKFTTLPIVFRLQFLYNLWITLRICWIFRNMFFYRTNIFLIIFNNINTLLNCVAFYYSNCSKFHVINIKYSYHIESIT